MSRRIAAILICAAEAQWQGHGIRVGRPKFDSTQVVAERSGVEGVGGRHRGRDGGRPRPGTARRRDDRFGREPYSFQVLTDCPDGPVVVPRDRRAARRGGRRLRARGDGVPRDVPDGVPVFGDGRPLPVLLRYAMPRAGVQLLAAARPLRLRAGHGTGVEAPLLRGPRVEAGVSRVARVSIKPNFPSPIPPSSTLDPLYPPSKQESRSAPRDSSFVSS